MSKIKISLVSGVILPIVTMLVTIMLFFVLGPKEKTSLFYVNLVYALILVAVFFGYINFVRLGKSKTSGAFYSVMGAFSTYYIIVGVAIMLVYNFLLTPVIPPKYYGAVAYYIAEHAGFSLPYVPLKFYISALIILTLLWIILGVLLAESDMHYRAGAVKLAERGKNLHYYVGQMSQIEHRYSALSKKLELPRSTQSYENEFSRLTVKFKSLVPGVFESEMAQSQLSNIISQCNNLLSSIENGEQADAQTIANNVKNTVNNAVNEIEFLKTSTRK